jgi:hypothetical protein
MSESTDPCRDLLGGTVIPAAKVPAWLAVLNTRCGHRGIEIANDVTNIYGVAWSDEVSLETMKGGLERCAYLAWSCVMTSAEMARFLRREMNKITVVATRNGIKRSAEAAFRSAFARVCRQFNVAEVLDGLEESVATMQTRWLAALPVTTDEENEQWPDLLSGMDARIEPFLRPFLHNDTSFLFKSLPLNGRALYLRCVYSMAEKEASAAASIAKEQFASESLMLRPSQLEENTALPNGVADGGEDNLQRIFRRWHYLAVTGVAVIAAMQAAIEAAVHPDNLAGEPDPSQSIRFEGDDFNGQPARVSVISAISKMEADHVYLGSGWVLTAPGVFLVTPVKVKTGSDRSDGIRFLTSQMANHGSTYRIPKVDDAQRIWESWFGKVLSLQEMFTDLPASLIIPLLTGILKTDDRRIYGWYDMVVEMKHQKKEPTLKQFVEHVRTQVLSTNTTRRDAKDELVALVSDFSLIPDCMALSAKLKQLWAQLFPPVTYEVEPMTKLLAMRQIHLLLHDIKYKGRSRHLLAQAWKDYTSYNNAEMFTSYIDDSLHVTAQATDQLAVKYLDSVCAQLTTAHKMHIQLNGATGSTTSEPVKASPKVAAARLLGVTPQVVATWIDSISDSGGKKRGRGTPDVPPSQGAGPAKKSQNNGGKGASPSRPSGSKTSELPPVDLKAALTKMKSIPHPHKTDDFVAGKLRGAFPGLKTLSFDEALKQLDQGGCTLCFQSDHYAKDCTAAGESPSDHLKRRISIYKKQLRQCIHTTRHAADS